MTEVDAGDDLPKCLLNCRQMSYSTLYTVGLERTAVFKDCLVDGPALYSLWCSASALAMDKYTAKRFLGLKTYQLADSVLLLPLKHFLRI